MVMEDLGLHGFDIKVAKLILANKSRKDAALLLKVNIDIIGDALTRIYKKTNCKNHYEFKHKFSQDFFIDSPLRSLFKAKGLGFRRSEVLIWKLAGLSNPEIAQKMNITYKGVMFHLVRAFKTLKCENSLDFYNKYHNYKFKTVSKTETKTIILLPGLK